MASWKKILVEGDNTNLGSSNLTQSDAARTYTVSGTTSSLSIKSEHGGNLARFVSGAVNSANDLVTFSAGVVEVVGSASAGSGTLRLKEASGNGTNYVNLTVPNLTSTYTVTLPAASPGGNNKILESDSNGDLSWITTPSGGGGSTTINNNANNRVITGSGTADTLEGEANLTYDGSNLAVVAGGIDLDNNRIISAKNTGGAKRTLAFANTSDQAVFNAGFNETVIGGGSGITLSGPVTAHEIVHVGSGISGAGSIGRGAETTVFGGTSSSGILAGRSYYYNGSGWSIATQSVEVANANLLGIAMGSSTNQGMCLKGFVQTDVTNLTPGKAAYMNTNATITTTVPTTSGNFSRIIGYAVTSSVIFFNPSNEYIELS